MQYSLRRQKGVGWLKRLGILFKILTKNCKATFKDSQTNIFSVTIFLYHLNSVDNYILTLIHNGFHLHKSLLTPSSRTDIGACISSASFGEL